ncbi:hypothetical protein B0A48_05528 [Cryoendolithus antarcticus]|uniref:TFIIB-type domain-containing protein n=1 Tax=Cryoendolithus antarcticus TaxID=1507870 RepID=A0A1V8TJ78_9PEZI|nr:hypothetical protein B0A48_05528 [Cryoendolithus antarcticus]
MELRVTLLLLASLGFNAGTFLGFSLPGVLTLLLVACSLPLVPGLLTLPSLARGAITGLPLRLLVCLVPDGHSRGLYRTDLRWVPVVRSCVAVPGLATRIALQERYEPHLSAHKAIKIGNVRRSGYFGLSCVVVPRPPPVPALAPVSRKVATPATTSPVVVAPWLPPPSDLVLPSAPATRLVPRVEPVRGARVAKRWTACAQSGWFPMKITISLSESPMEGTEPSLAPQPWVGDRYGDVEMEDVVRPEEMEASLEWLELGRDGGEGDGEESEGEEMDWSADEGVSTQQLHQSSSDDDDDDPNAALVEDIEAGGVADEAAAAAAPASQGNSTPQEEDLSERMICKDCRDDPPLVAENENGELVCDSCGLVLAAADYQV